MQISPKRALLLFLSLAFSLGAGFALKFNFHFHPSQPFIAFTNSDIWDFWNRISGGVSTNLLSANIWKLEYPLLTKVFVYATYNLTHGLIPFFSLTAIVFSILIVIASFLLYKIMVEEVQPFWRLILFWALAPSMFAFAFFNWDILSVFCVILAIYLYRKNHDIWAAIAIALGTWFKLFPLMMLIPALLQRYKEGKKRKVFEILLTFFIVTLAVNLPQILNNYKDWSYFLTFNASRPPMHLESFWVGIWVLSDKFLGHNFYLRKSYEVFVNQASVITFGLGYLFLLVWFWKKKTKEIFLRFSFTGLLMLLASTKIFSPQYTLWLLPFYVFLPTDVLLTALLEISSFFVFYGSAQYLYYNYDLRLTISPGHWYAWSFTALLLRQLAIIGLIITTLKNSRAINWLKSHWFFLLIGTIVLGSSLFISYLLKSKYFLQPMYKRDPNLYFLSYTDIAQFIEFVGSQAPIPYIQKAIPYPVLLGFIIYLHGVFSKNNDTFFAINSISLSIFAILDLLLVYKIAKDLGTLKKWRVILFWILSPSVFIYSIYNWDVIPIFMTLLSIYFYLKKRDILASIILSLAISTKFFPIFLLPAIILERWKEKDLKAVKKIILTTVVLTVAINLPFALNNFFAWSFFFQHSLTRDHSLDTIWTTLWVVSDQVLGPTVPIRYTFENTINKLSLVLFFAGSLVVFWRAWKSPKKVFLPLSLSFFLVFLLVTRTFSAGYILWVLPFLILIPTNIIFSVLLDWVGAILIYIFFEYIYWDHDLRLVKSPGHWLQWLLETLALRHIALLGLLISLWLPLKKIIPLKIFKNETY